MASLFLSEKGFGRGSRGGKAVVLADKEGKPLKLQLGELQTGAIGGRALIIHSEPINQKWYRSHMVIDGPVYELTVERCGDKGGNILIKQFNIDVNNNRNLTIHEMSVGYFVNKDKTIRYVGTVDSDCSEEAQKLINGKLSDAFIAAINRSYDPKPARIYFGSIATDAPAFKKEWTKREVEVEQEVTV